MPSARSRQRTAERFFSHRDLVVGRGRPSLACVEERGTAVVWAALQLKKRIAANAQNSVARAEHFPSFRSTACSTRACSKRKPVLDYGVNSTMPIFTAGGIAGTVQSSEAAQGKRCCATNRRLRLCSARFSTAWSRIPRHANSWPIRRARWRRCATTWNWRNCATRTAAPAKSRGSTPSGISSMRR